MQEIDKEISEMKISVNTRARIASIGIPATGGNPAAPGFFKSLLAWTEFFSIFFNLWK